MKRIENFVLPEHHNNLYKEEAISSIALARDVAEKINEIVDELNELSKSNLEKTQEQDGKIRKGILYMKDNLLNTMNDLMVTLRDSGFIDDRIEYHCDHLKERLDNLLGKVKEGSTTLDAELIDIRTDVDGIIHASAGTSIRKQILGSAIYNVTHKHPLDSGEFYTLETALPVIPKDARKTGLIIAIRTSSSKWEYFNYTVGTTTDEFWLDSSCWNYLNNVFDSFYNVTEKHPLTEGFHTLESAIQSIPKFARKSGLIITFRRNAEAGWDMYQYTVKDFSDVNWINKNNWRDISNDRESSFVYRGKVLEDGRTSFKECRKEGYFNFLSAEIKNIIDAPEDLTRAGNLFVYRVYGGSTFGQHIRDLNGNEWFRFDQEPFKKINKTVSGSGGSPKINDVKWLALGDSITEGYYSSFNDDGTTSMSLDHNKSWTKFVADALGFDLTNKGVGGSGYVATRTTENPVKNAVEQVENIDFTKYNLVTLAYGINDYRYNCDIVVVVNNLKSVLSKVASSNPECKIIVFTPLNCSILGTALSNWAYKSANNVSSTLENYVNQIKSVCEENGVEYIDLTLQSIINKHNIQTLLPDGVHPSLECHKLLSGEIAKKLSFC